MRRESIQCVVRKRKSPANNPRRLIQTASTTVATSSAPESESELDLCSRWQQVRELLETSFEKAAELARLLT